MTSKHVKDFCSLSLFIHWSTFFLGSIEAQSPEKLFGNTLKPQIKDVDKVCADDDEAERTMAMAFDFYKIESSWTFNGNPEELKEYGSMCVLEGEFQRAIRCLNKAIRLNADEPRYRRNRGLSFLRLGRLDLASADFHKALTLDPYSVRGNVQMGMVLNAMGNIKKAVQFLEKSSAYTDSRVTPEHEKFQVEKKLKEALDRLEEIENLNNKSEKLSSNEVMLTEESNELVFYDPCGTDEDGETKSSRTNFEPWGEEIFLIFGETLRDWANEFFKAGDLKHALRCYNKAVSMKSNEAKFYRNRGLCHLKMNESQLAIDDYKTSLELEPQSLVGHFLLGYHLLDSGKYMESVNHLEKVIYSYDDEAWGGNYQIISDKLKTKEDHLHLEKVADTYDDKAWNGNY